MPVTAPFVEQLLTNMAATAQDRVAIILKFMRYEVRRHTHGSHSGKTFRPCAEAGKSATAALGYEIILALAILFFRPHPPKQGKPIKINY
ncbi:hypothetical protein CXT87_06500 [Akkermansia muciniphila]|nr:hypothetical protein CXT93_01080 [Akkermansia muciniphila]PNC99647.1 hypothetical protein CXT87_06500 [Akkermansia muciniphila]PND03581.1 hypothetical protein CXT86_11550 [Akkermansia muciniphila]PND09901.1 hypothetical protein CXT85_07935 [Akkermansia muciniphila]